MANLLLLNGPNLNLLGTREPEVYGSKSLDDIVSHLTTFAAERGAQLEHFQTNGEQPLIERVHQAKNDGTEFILINPGALTHTSIGLRDAILGVGIEFIEIHLSNVFSRESFRHQSYLSDIAVGCIIGLGAKGYELGVTAALEHLGQ